MPCSHFGQPCTTRSPPSNLASSAVARVAYPAAVGCIAKQPQKAGAQRLLPQPSSPYRHRIPSSAYLALRTEVSLERGLGGGLFADGALDEISFPNALRTGHNEETSTRFKQSRAQNKHS